MPTVETKPSLSQTFKEILSAPSANSGGRPEREATQGTLRREDASIEQSASQLFERDQLQTSLHNANRRLRELKEELQFVKIEKIALAANTNLDVAETKNLMSEKDSLMNVYFEQHRKSAPGKRASKANMFSGVDLHSLGGASKVLKDVFAFFSREMAETNLFDAVAKR